MKILACLIMLVFSIPSFAGYIVKTQSGQDDISTSFIEDNMIREIGDDDVIIDFDKKQMIHLNHKNKTYLKIGFTEFSSQFKKMQEGAIQLQLESIPEAQRETYKAMYQKMLDDLKKPYTAKVEVKKSGQTETILSRECTGYSVYEDEIKVEEVFVAEGYDPVGSDKMIELLDYIAIIEDYNNTAEYKSLYKKGMILKTIDIKDEYTDEVIEITKENIPASKFQIPENYTAQDINDFFSE